VLLLSFDEVSKRHEELPADDYNDDSVYKDALDQILSAKEHAVKKQAAVVELIQAGAKPSFLGVMRTAQPGDFNTTSLEQECPEYSWRLLFSGWFRFVKEVTVPLRLAPCLIALVWRVVLDEATNCDSENQECELQTVRLGERLLQLSDLLPTIRLLKLGLQSKIFENVVLGFFLASATGNSLNRESGLGTSENNAQTILTAADLHGLEFSERGALRLAQTIVDCRVRGSLRSVNGLLIERPDDSRDLQCCIRRNVDWQESLTRDDHENVASWDLGARLDAADWGFVTAEAACNKWQSLSVKCSRLGPSGAIRMAVGLGSVTSLTALDISSNDLQAEGATAAGGALTSLVALIWLEAGQNRIGTTGAAALAAGARRVSGLQGLGLAKNEIGESGVSFVRDHLAALTTLVRLDLTNNFLDEAGGKALAIALQRMPQLTVMDLGGQNVNGATWLILKVLSGRIESLCIESGSVRAKLVVSSTLMRTQPFAVSSISPNSQEERFSGIIVDLSGRKALGPEGSYHLATALLEGGAAVKLTTLELALNGILPQGASKLAPALATLSSLTRLGLSTNGIERSGSQEIASVLPGLKRLRSLSLEGNAICVAGWLELAETLCQLPQLSSLNGSEDFGALVAGIAVDLDLAGKELAAAVAALLPLNGNTLKSLDISANHLDASASDFLTCDDPACKIVHFLGSLSSLTRLRVGSNALGEAGCLSLGSTLEKLVLLTELDISRVTVELGQGAHGGADAIAKALRGLTQLQTLRIANNAVRAEGAERVCRALASSSALCSIDLGLNQLGSCGATVLAEHLPTLWGLETLKAPENAFGSDGGRALGAGLARLSRLTLLDLRCNDLGPAGGEAVLDGLAVSAATAGPTLSTLDLRNNGVGADVGAGTAGAEQLAWLDRFARLSGLVTLSLAANNLDHAGGLLVVAAIAHHSGLSELDLGDNALGSDCGQAISEELGRLPALRTLFLEGNSLGREGAGAVVSQLGVLATIATLDLRDNRLGPDGGIAVGGVLSRLTALRELDLEGNALESLGGDAVASGVAGLKFLEALDLRHNSLGPEGCSSVQAILSHLGSLRLDVGWNDVAGMVHENKHSLRRASLQVAVVNQLSNLTPMRKRESQRAMYATIRGSLQKLGQGRDPDGDTHWRDRLCFIAGGSLYYESAKKKGEKELVTALANIRNVLPPPVDTRPGRFMFTVEVEGNANGKSMTFAAATDHERKRWITALLRQRQEELATPETPHGDKFLT
jgi:Ran GTPase-activating protein (RanGAP) involved in mRNA processing and transport